MASLFPLAVLREIGGSLIDIHGQHENQELMDEKHHIHLLDYFAQDEFARGKRTVSEAYHAYRELKKEVACIKFR